MSGAGAAQPQVIEKINFHKQYFHIYFIEWKLF